MSIPSSIWFRDLNRRPLNHESSPITTRPGLPPFNRDLVTEIFSMKEVPTATTMTFGPKGRLVYFEFRFEVFT